MTCVFYYSRARYPGNTKLTAIIYRLLVDTFLVVYRFEGLIDCLCTD